MQGLGRASPTNGSVDGHRREVNENEIQVLNEDELHKFGGNEVNEASVIKMREGMHMDLMNVGNGLINDNARIDGNNDMRVLSENKVMRRSNVQVWQANVHAAQPSAAGPRVSRGLSPFNPLIQAPPAHCVDTVTAATACTTTRSTSLPLVRPRTDLLRITTSAHESMDLRDPNVDRPVYVFWQGQARRVLGAVEAPQVQALHTSSEEYFTSTRRFLRFEPYPPTEKRRKMEPAIRSAMRELNEQREKSRLRRSVPKPRITNDVPFRDLNRIKNADAYYGGFAHDAEARRTRVRGVKQSASFISPMMATEDRAAYANAKRRSAGTETRKATREVGT